ncbi:hypothetical protein SAMN02745947_05504 [Rhodococcus rhodochrous J3]|uniref:Uncharacterized protein n=1 Tax=Rhodococcus rhodochrous J3 TaxID=903528 RepID=A0ABY1MJ77_RHORH|nr:hypothetical protein [Rhodococcus rhodochrous]MBF4476788.1 hypothetical protein [Rhodococcus rhodochrous]SMG59797.1 hypothetical protein SAMN02745947_05504 [Rhodococcus rhodochrous J3]
MTAPVTALPTGFATEVDGAAALIVGGVHSFPRHPQRGALAQPFAGAQSSASEVGVIGVPLYALVAVDWATEVTTTIERDGRTRTVFTTGWLGTPRGVTWYLHPAVHDAERGLYLLDASERFAASASTAEVPAAVARAARSWDLGVVPERVRVHNFPL